MPALKKPARAAASSAAAAGPRIVIVDDHPMFRVALRQLLPGAGTIELDSFAALKSRLQTQPDADLILLDLLMPDVEGFAALLYLHHRHPGLRVAIISGIEDPSVIQRALDFGACAYLPKTLPMATLGKALFRVLAGGRWSPPPRASKGRRDAQDIARKVAALSAHQFRVLMALADGRLNKEIGHELGVAEATIKFHISGILRTLGLHSRTQAALLAQRLRQVQEVSGVAGASGAKAE